MVTRISESIPASALRAPSTEARTESLHTLRLECEAQTDGPLSALLLHEASRLHESRDDLAAAARDALAATKADGNFIEPIEGLIGIAIRSRSKGNLARLFSRLEKLASTQDQKLQAALGYIQTQLTNNQQEEAKTQILASLVELPDSAELWLMLEELAAKDQDPQLLLRATLGRAAHSRSAELRSLLLERAARLQFKANEPEAAFSSFAQGFDEVPTWRALRAWEARSIADQNYHQAKEAASKTSALILAALDEPDEAILYQIPEQELRMERALAAHLRAVVYAVHDGEWSTAEDLLAQLAEAASQSHIVQLLRAELSAHEGSVGGQAEAFQCILSNQLNTFVELSLSETNQSKSIFPASEQTELTDDELIYALTYLSLAARGALDADLEQRANAHLLNRTGAGWIGTLLHWQEMERDLRPSDELWSVIDRQLEVDDSNWLDRRPSSTLAHKQELAESRAFSLIFSASDPDVLNGSEASEPSLSASAERIDLKAQALLQALSELEVTWSASDDHGRPSTRTEHYRSHLKRLVARLRNDLPAEIVALNAQLALSHDEPAALGQGQKAEASDLLRALVVGQVSGARLITEADVQSLTRVLDDPWIPVALRLVAADDPTRQIETFGAASTLSTQGQDLDWLRALDALRLNVSLPHPQHELSITYTPISDPFVIGMRLGIASQLESNGADEERARPGPELEISALNDAVKHINDPELQSAWRLRLALHRLRAENTGAALEELRLLEATHPHTVFELKPWITCLGFTSDPAEAFSLRSHSFSNSDGSVQPALSSIDSLCLTARFRSNQLADALSGLSKEIPEQDPSTETQVLHLASALWTVSSLDRKSLFNYDSGSDNLGLTTEISALTASQQCLLLAAADDLAPDEELAIRRHFADLRPSHVADLGVWTLARRAANERQRHRAIWRMAKRMGSPSLAAYADQEQLSTPESEEQRHFLEACLDDPTVSASERDYIGLTLFQNQSSQGDVTDARALERLATTLAVAHAQGNSSQNEVDPDAQLALLCAGYGYAQAEQFELALACFEPLVGDLASDPALCVGLRLVAERTGRADLEAACTVELAGKTLDQHQASQLWEHAGVLYQERLQNEKLAEECFTAALVHVPGSPLAFDRLYRMAKRRGDRPRQVELLDARLLTADSDDLRIELLWEKARYCRMLGRRDASQRAIVELLSFEPEHLPSLALLAELHLVEERWEQAAEALRAVALHPKTGENERKSAGIYAADLFDRVNQPREAVALLDALERPDEHQNEDVDNRDLREPRSSALSILKRKARALARTSDWGAAFSAYAELNDQQDEIPERLESAQMMLAIQRDHLKNSDLLKESARRVLRDAPTDLDAIKLALELGLSADDRQHLLAPARQESRARLRQNPLNLSEIELFARLCHECDDDEIERVALGILSLLGSLAEPADQRLRQLSYKHSEYPTHPWGPEDHERIVPSTLLTPAAQFLSLLAPTLTAELEADLDVRGISPLMREDEFSESPIRAEVSTWASAFGLNEFALFVGGMEDQLVSALSLNVPTIIVGRAVDAPFSRASQAQLASLLMPLRFGAAIVTSQPLEVVQTWMNAAVTLIVSDGNVANQPDLLASAETNLDHDQIVRRLDELLDRDLRQELSDCYYDAQKLGLALDQLPKYALMAGLRAAALTQGDPSVVRVLPEFLPSGENERTELMADLIQFCLSDDFFELRRKAGLRRS